MEEIAVAWPKRAPGRNWANFLSSILKNVYRSEENCIAYAEVCKVWKNIKENFIFKMTSFDISKKSEKAYIGK